MKYVSLLCLAIMLLSSCSTSSDRTPFDYGRIAGSAYVLAEDKLDEDKLSVLKKAWDVLNLVVDGDTSDLKLKDRLDKLVVDKTGDYAPLVQVFVDEQWSALDSKYSLSTLSLPLQLDLLRDFRNGVRSVVMDNIESLDEDERNGLLPTD